MKLPRNGRYEIFSNQGRTYCFDDVDLSHFPTPPGMHEWIRSQDTTEWAPIKTNPESNTALYLSPKLYLMWKLRWAC